ncbi:MAG: hypothetical protein ACRC68_05690, partial [Clostridium sp.]
NTNNASGGSGTVMTTSQLANLNAWSQQWVNGSISLAQLQANAKADAQEVIEGLGKDYIGNIQAVKQTFQGDNPSTMYVETGNRHFMFSRAYYDGNTNTTTVYVVSGKAMPL